VAQFTNQSRILIVGTSGSGKSTLARQISQKMGIPDIELDALFWKSNWTQSDPEEFRQKIANAISKNTGFVIHGNYNKVRDLTWGNADTVIWLDYSRSLVMWRVIKRSVLRIFKNESLWAGNKEGLRKTFFSKESIILWAWQTYEVRKKQYLESVKNPEYKNINVVRFEKPNQASEFLRSL
jgi:adenylate kinase family enzyme